ncbi:MAG TPA: GNAT family N-acetyltransferase [Nitrosospira sp.]
MASASGNALDLSLLGVVPLELDPRWLGSHANGVDKYVRYFLLGDQQRPCGYAPFFVHSGTLAYCLGETAVLNVPVTRYAMQEAPLCENHALLPGLFKPLYEAIGKRGVVFFEGVPADTPLAGLLTSADSPVRDLFHVVPYGPAYTRRLIVLPAGANFEDYLKTLGRKTREDVRRTHKNFSVKAGKAVTITRYTEPEQAAGLADILAHISRKTYQYHLLGLGLENTPERVIHLRAAAASGWLRAYVLWVGSMPTAFGLGYRQGPTYYGHHVGYDPAISKLQPGVYLHMEVMADLLADGICRFDFLPGDNLYKQRLSNQVRDERHYYLIPRGWPGTAYARTLVVMNFLSETIGRLLDKSGLKERVKRVVRITTVKRSARKN